MEHAWAAGAAAIGDSGASAKGAARNTQPHDRAAAAGGATAGGNGRGKDAVSFLGGDDGYGGKGAVDPAGNGAGNAAVPLRAFTSRNRKTLEQGYFTAAGGFRVGVCMLPDAGRQGLALSLCIRLPRELPGAAREVYPVWRKSSGIILAGPPASGKTTVLRDLCRMISAGVQDGPCRTVLIDERNELSGWDGKRAAFRLGPCTDILSAYQRNRRSVGRSARFLRR